MSLLDIFGRRKSLSGTQRFSRSRTSVRRRGGRNAREPLCAHIKTKSKSDTETSITASDWIGAFKGPNVCAQKFSRVSPHAPTSSPGPSAWEAEGPGDEVAHARSTSGFQGRTSPTRRVNNALIPSSCDVPTSWSVRTSLFWPFGLRFSFVWLSKASILSGASVLLDKDQETE